MPGTQRPKVRRRSRSAKMKPGQARNDRSRVRSRARQLTQDKVLVSWACAILTLLLAALLLLACVPVPSEVEAERTPPDPLASGEPVPTGLQSPSPSSRALRLFWLNSYTADNKWSQQIRTGILERLGREGYSTPDATLEFQAFHMDVAHYQNLSVPGADAAIAAIQAFGPDIVVVSDDEAIYSVIPRYPDPNMPFVFCGLNAELKDYDLLRPNVTGVLERPMPVQTLRMAAEFLPGEFLPGTERYVILGDSTLSGKAAAAFAQDQIAQSAVISEPLAVWTTNRWELWEEIVSGSDIDFILLGHYHALQRENGETLSSSEVMQWLIENSPVPIFGLWDFSIRDGAVAGLVVSAYEQGDSAANIILRLARGAHPSSIMAVVPARNLLAMNLAAAQHWDLLIPVELPLAARVYRTLPALEGGQ